MVEIAPGTRVEVRLVSERRLKGLRGEVTEDGFLLMNGVKGNGGSERIAFADVRSIKVLKSHTTRNVLIVVGVGVVVVAVIFAVALGRAFTTYN